MSKRETIIYIAGKYSAETRDEISLNIHKAFLTAQTIWSLGYFAFCPHKNTEHFEELVPSLTHEDYIVGDIAMLERCDAIFMVDGWKESNGAIREHARAEQLGIQIFYDIEDLRRWNGGN